ncbi:hypothetical protein Mgra_00000484 [Meloidogyne graminicola]|uniref:Uncharacterized protein n=1 Tax=Meloidogyne graminicola TaxID=189291 RepID=A0A8T0A3Z4_9BILA|nr:hypothetical protein Mgra_00000484 [Meloidogyne graminicola]
MNTDLNNNIIILGKVGKNKYEENLTNYLSSQKDCSNSCCLYSVTSIVGGSFTNRSQKLNQIARELNLNLHSLIDNLMCSETFYISPIRRSSTHCQLSLQIVNLNRSFNGQDVAIIKCSYGERGNNFEFRWPFCEFNSFLWAFRGVCTETFYPSMREQLGFPQIEEPFAEESENLGINFSIFEMHRELRLEELANDLVLDLQRRKSKEGKGELIFKKQNSKTKSLYFIENRNTIYVTTKIIKGKYLKDDTVEHWPKFTRSYFRFAVLGKAMKFFYQK